MSVFKNLFDAVRLNPEEDDDDFDNDLYDLDDDYDDDDDDDFEEERRPKKPSYRERKAAEKAEKAEREAEKAAEREAERAARERAAAAAPAEPARPERTVKPVKPAGKITPINKSQRRQVVEMEVCVIKPINMDDESEIANTLLSGTTVILNFEGMQLDVAQRIIDFTCGATYAMGGSLRKVSNFIFLATPNGVDISGDISDIMETMDTAF